MRCDKLRYGASQRIQLTALPHFRDVATVPIDEGVGCGVWEEIRYGAMRIGIDARALSQHGGGEETYIRNIINALATVDRDNDYTLFLATPLALDSLLPSLGQMRCVVLNARSRLIRMFVAFPLALRHAHIDVVHVQNIAPLSSLRRAVVTVHDIGYERYPQFYRPGEVKWLRLIMPLMVRHAALVLTGSEYSRQDIVRRYRVPSEKVVVVPYAAESIFHPVRDDARLHAVRARYDTGESFILCVSGIQPRKNLKTLIDAYVQLRQRGTIQHKLVLVGGKAWLYDETFTAARDSGYDQDLVFTGLVPDDDLVALYNAADVFVYPSIFEGFGLPPLEAMACGTPVITSNTSSLPEVVGAAALLIDPLDREQLAIALARVLSDATLRARLSAQGLQRSNAFSWERTARMTLDAYRHVARRSMRRSFSRQI